MARTRVVTNRKTYKWCGKLFTRTVEDAAGTAASDVEKLCADLTSQEPQGDVTIEKILLDVTTRRVLETGIQRVGFYVAVQKVDVGTSFVSEVLDPVSLSQDEFQLGNRDILIQGLLGVPPVLSAGDTGTSEVTSELLRHHFEFNGRRKLHRLNNAITFTVLCEVTNIVQVTVMSRILLRYS